MDINQLLALSSPTARSGVLLHGLTLRLPNSAGGNPIPGISSATHPSFPWAITAVRVRICGKAFKINKWLYWLKIDELMVNVAKLKVS